MSRNKWCPSQTDGLGISDAASQGSRPTEWHLTLKTSQPTFATEFSTALRAELGKTDESLLSVIPVSWRSGHPQSYPSPACHSSLGSILCIFELLDFFPLFEPFFCIKTGTQDGFCSISCVHLLWAKDSWYFIAVGSLSRFNQLMYWDIVEKLHLHWMSMEFLLC